MIRIEVRGKSPYNDNTFSVIAEDTSLPVALHDLKAGLRIAKWSIRDSFNQDEIDDEALFAEWGPEDPASDSE